MLTENNNMESERVRITAIIPTYNEETLLPRALASVQFADEILVIDSFSTDATVEIAKLAGARVVQHKYEYSAAQKNRAIPMATNEWIFLLDADEWIETDLQTEIERLLRKEPRFKGYAIPRINYYMNQRIRYSGWQNDEVLRFFHRDSCRYEDKRVHAKLKVPGGKGKLKHPIHHNTYRSFQDMLRKVNQYSTWKALDKVDKGKKASWASMIYLPIHAFIKTYVLRAGILDGRVGYILSVIAAGSAFLRQVKIWRIRQGEQMD